MTGNLFTGEGISLPKLRDKRNALARDLRAVDEAINALERLEKTGLMGAASIPVKTIPQEDNQLVDISHMGVAEGAVQLLTEKGVPMKTRDIVDELGKRGKIIGAKDPLTSVFSSLNKSFERTKSKINKLGNGLWGLKEWI